MLTGALPGCMVPTRTRCGVIGPVLGRIIDHDLYPFASQRRRYPGADAGAAARDQGLASL